MLNDNWWNTFWKNRFTFNLFPIPFMHDRPFLRQIHPYETNIVKVRSKSFRISSGFFFVIISVRRNHGKYPVRIDIKTYRYNSIPWNFSHLISRYLLGRCSTNTIVVTIRTRLYDRFILHFFFMTISHRFNNINQL